MENSENVFSFKCDFCNKTNVLEKIQKKFDELKNTIYSEKQQNSELIDKINMLTIEMNKLKTDHKISKETNIDLCIELQKKTKELNDYIKNNESNSKETIELREQVKNLSNELEQLKMRHEELCNNYETLLKEKNELEIKSKALPKPIRRVRIIEEPEIKKEEIDFEKQKIEIEAKIRKEYEEKYEKEKEKYINQITELQTNLKKHISLTELKKKS